MPCTTDHMQPTAAEQHRQQAAMLLAYVYHTLGYPVSDLLVKETKNMYQGSDVYVNELCSQLKLMPPETLRKITYDAGEKGELRGLELALWWARHRKFDGLRKLAERQAQLELDQREAALKKVAHLTPEECRILGIQR